MDFAARHFSKAFDKGVLAKNALVFELLSDERELEDTVGPYGKSLLYLVSRALEQVHKMPLLGLAAAWRLDGDRPDVFNRHKASDIKTWLKLWGSTPPNLVNDKQVSDGLGWIKATHGSFDNNVEVVGRTLERIVGKRLEFQVESLRGF